ncbi:hypothetical protein HU830_06365 [Lactobacillus sp. DCY120]|uniref:N-acetyltransferase domain-containing protein n=1 Tax=Bombilactobacillus apium TaxID=2675299 RepID=A0A850RDE3_9LACO|nr:hypothetical protein [Bombilactobacillus apium]NVY96778.1 hypothetical protein [Bombilactobacillus apium]
MEPIFLRSSQVQDLDRISQLFQEGRRVLAQEQIPQWQDGYPLTIDSHYHGQHLGNFFFSNLISQAYQQGQRELRIDTHAQNQRMQHLATKWGFEKRGIVYLDHNPQDQRLAYQLFL